MSNLILGLVIGLGAAATIIIIGLWAAKYVPPQSQDGA